MRGASCVRVACELDGIAALQAFGIFDVRWHGILCIANPAYPALGAVKHLDVKVIPRSILPYPLAFRATLLEIAARTGCEWYANGLRMVCEYVVTTHEANI